MRHVVKPKGFESDELTLISQIRGEGLPQTRGKPIHGRSATASLRWRVCSSPPPLLATSQYPFTEEPLGVTI